MSMAESTEHGASPPGVSGVASTPAAMVEIAACAWDMVHAAERMRMRWAEADVEVRNRELWTPLHTAADVLRERLDLVAAGEREWNPGDPPLLPPVPEESRWPVAEMLARQLAGVKAQRDALRAYVEQDLGVKQLLDAYCGQLSVHAPHVVTHGPDQPRLCPGRQS